jgi:quinoprotein glucose dehydrogenase
MQMASGQTLYTSTCQACHGAERRGVASAPELLTVKNRLTIKDFQLVVNAGKGEMPAFPNLTENDVKNIYNYVSSSPAGGNQNARFAAFNLPAGKVSGPVVDSGGAPGGLAQRPVTGGFGRGNDYGPPYPEGVQAPQDRYFIPPGWGLSFPYIISPPWSTITAYDLNTGKVKWQVPIGSDKEAEKEGAKNTGMLRAQRQSMAVTSSGVLFCTGKDGKVYAFDVDNGKQLWSYELPTGTEGIPAIYEVNGKHYLAVCASTPLRFGRQAEEPQNNSVGPGAAPQTPPSSGTGKGSYVVFALPDKK